MKNEEREFSRNIALYIGVLEKRRRQYLTSCLKEYHLKGSMFLMLLFLDRHPNSSQDDLVEFIGIDKSGIARKCRKLEDLGYLLREPMVDNRRQYKLTLTETGRALLPVIRGHLLNWNQLITEGMSKAEQKEMILHLEKMADNAEKKYR